MLNTTKQKILNDLVSGAGAEDLIWIQGYLAGLLAGKEVPGNAAAQPVNGIAKLTLAYGTETGNAKSLAGKLAAAAKQKGAIVKLASLDQYRLADLPKEENFIVVISTQGDGEPPVGAKKFYDHLFATDQNLSKLKFGVLALGDTSYPLFCKAGEDVDERLEKLGGRRIAAIQKCDTDYEADAAEWFGKTIQALAGQNVPSATSAGIAATKKSGSHKKQYNGTVLTNINLNDRGSSKQTHHIEIAAERLEYEPGDSIGVLPVNSEIAIQQVLHVAGIDRSKTISYRNEEATIHHLLKNRLNISYLPERVVAQYAAIIRQEIPATKIGLYDLLKIHPIKDAGQFEEVVQVLEPMAPRLYSISSSPAAHDGEVHITVSRDQFHVAEEKRCGICSDYLTNFSPEAEISFYVHANRQFRLPEPERAVIMIGPGTGIAPFRAFLAERDATGATGQNWLFFGDQHFETDFLYQTEIQSWMETGLLTRVNVAFSRDQKEKIYVQHKMLANGAAFYEWLEAGANIYICGAKEPMSVDVEDTILEIIATHGNLNTDDANLYLEKLKDDGRYLKDVY